MDPTFLRPFTALAAFLIGACIGSFLNVCVYRIPLNRSVVHPGSHCSACGAPIPWHYNLPIFSWFVLKGRAACCGTRIDFRYALVEAGTAALFLALSLRYPPVEAVIYSVMVSGIIVACLIDLDHYIIPDRFTLGGCLAGFIFCAARPSLMNQAHPMQGLSWSLFGAVVGALTLLSCAWIGTLIFKKEAMGMGDVKFLGAICAFFGPLSVTWLVPLSAMIGSVLGLALIIWQRGAWGTRIPYGPFLGLAAILWLFGGSQLTYAYWSHIADVWHMSTSPVVDQSGLIVPGR